ncbi:PREDICTED: uncharacterized protein LOC105563911 [Vollenhovia emeryi]|uniref:uncharacterized protein LOC105563911 n=1 Tax=Vollenhovia emeryi TaxID=411798 RepID=UPI0005F40243|nr:PREDICTED: uncharacterized protein LOC105563911 [Vollenhovia emeryi]
MRVQKEYGENFYHWCGNKSRLQIFDRCVLVSLQRCIVYNVVLFVFANGVERRTVESNKVNKVLAILLVQGSGKMVSLDSHSYVCLCPPISYPLCPPSSSSHLLVKDVCSKYYQEIGAEMISNQLIIRLEKDKNKSKRKRKEWDPPCDCIEIQRPTSKTGPKIINAEYDDRIVFRVHSALKGKEDPYKSQTIAYKVGSCRDGQGNHQCKTITVYPQFSSGTQEVYSDHITEGNEDIFLLRIKKKAEYSEQKDRNVEFELRTPKPPPIPPPEPVPEVTPPQTVADVDVDVEEEPDVVEEIAKQPTHAKGKNHKRKKKRK